MGSDMFFALPGPQIITVDTPVLNHLDCSCREIERCPSFNRLAPGRHQIKVALRDNKLLRSKLHAQARNKHAGSENLDRKSTRLNSSHGYISYAVFCLKKKT